jgi:hypothetical protein
LKHKIIKNTKKKKNRKQFWNYQDFFKYFFKI